jgi:hypothetical protein
VVVEDFWVCGWTKQRKHCDSLQPKNFLKKKGDGHTKPKKKSENDFVLCHFHEKHTHTHALTKNELNPTNNFSLFVLLKHTKKEIFKKIFTG